MQRRESKTAHVAALRHALVKLDTAAGRGGQQREIEVADVRVLHRELVEDAVVCLDRRCTAHIFRQVCVIAELVHQRGEVPHFCRRLFVSEKRLRSCAATAEAMRPSRARRPAAPCSRAIASISNCANHE